MVPLPTAVALRFGQCDAGNADVRYPAGSRRGGQDAARAHRDRRPAPRAVRSRDQSRRRALNPRRLLAVLPFKNVTQKSCPTTVVHMSRSDRHRRTNASRRNFLKTAAGVAAGTFVTRTPLGAQSAGTTGMGRAGELARINPTLMITPALALEWNMFKARQCGPTYAGSVGWKTLTAYLLERMPKMGAVDFDFIEMPYDHYIVEDWPDKATHLYDSGKAVEQLVSDGTPVPMVASYGMTSGSTPKEGLTAPMIFYDPANPPSDGQMAGKIMVCQTTHQNGARRASGHRSSCRRPRARRSRSTAAGCGVRWGASQPPRSRDTRLASSSSTTCRRPPRLG